MSEYKLRVPAPLQFTPSCFRCGAQEATAHKPTCPNVTPAFSGRGRTEMNTQQELDHKKFIGGLGLAVGTPEEQDQMLYEALWPIFGAKEELE